MAAAGLVFPVTEPVGLSEEELKDSEGKQFNRKSFAGMNLRQANFRHATCLECDFSGADMTFASLEYGNFWGSNFTNTILNRADGAHASFENTIWMPKDAYGFTFTLQCETFMNMKIDPLWLRVWFFIPSLWRLPEEDVPDKWLSKIIDILGMKTYLKYKAIFSRRVV